MNYKCNICGKEYQTIPERARCELECFRKSEIEMKKAEQEKLNSQKLGAIAEIESLLDEKEKLSSRISEKVGLFCKDYGEPCQTKHGRVYLYNEVNSKFPSIHRDLMDIFSVGKSLVY